MAWPFSNIVAPNFDSGFTTLPSSLTNVPNSPASTVAAWLLGILLVNTTGVSQTVTLNDGSGKAILPALVLAANEVKAIALEFLPVTGVLQWTCGAASAVNAKIWGYT